MWMSREFERQLDLKPILRSYDIQFLENQTHFIIKRCPNCSGTNKFFLDKKTKMWVCFKCVQTDNFDNKDGRGNLLTFFKLIGLSDEEIRGIIKNGEAFHFTDPDMFTRPQKEVESKGIETIQMPASFEPLTCSPENLRKHYEAYKYLFSRHVNDMEVIKRFDLRYDSHSKRLIFPVYDRLRNLVGYQGRDITDRWKVNHPKCSNEECELKFRWYFRDIEKAPLSCPSCESQLEDHHYPKSKNSKNFPKIELFFNQHNVDWSKTVVIVEGPFDCINVDNSVALLGKALSKKQINILLERAKKLVLYLDGDDAGKFSTKSLIDSIGAFFDDLLVCPLDPGKDPGSFNRSQNQEYLSKNSISSKEWILKHLDKIS